VGFLPVALFLAAGLIWTAPGTACAAPAQNLSASPQSAQEQNNKTQEGGRLYIFRPIRSFGAHIHDYITLNGVPAYRLTPGTGFYCDLPSGEYVVAVAQHNSNSLKVSVTAGQASYVSVMLHQSRGAAPRTGALTSDQSFDVRLVDPGFGAQRVHEYQMVSASCQLSPATK